MFFIIIERLSKSVHFAQKTVKMVRLLLKENLQLIFFLCWRPKEVPNRICQLNRIALGNCCRSGHLATKAIILDKFFIVILIPSIQRITLLLNHLRRYEKPSHKVCIFFAQKPWKKMCSWYFFHIKDCMTASRNISMFFKERAAAS